MVFVCNRSQESVQDTLGLRAEVDDADMLTPGGPFLVSVYADPAGAIVFERSGYLAALRPVMEELSIGTTAAGVSRTFEGDIVFAYAQQGAVISAFNVDDPTARRGYAPDAIARQIEDLGFPVFDDDLDEEDEEGEAEDDDEHLKRQQAFRCALALCTQLTDLRLTQEHLLTPLPRYPTASLYSRGGASTPMV